MSETLILKINRSLLIFGISGLASGIGGFTTAVVAFTTLRNDVKELTRQVTRLDGDRDTIVRHTAEINNLTVEIRRLTQ
jgi:uncharacterized membrane protein